MSQKLVDKLAPGGANFYTTRSDEKWRHIHDVCTSLCDTSTTSARHAYEMKTRTRILNRLKFSPLLAEYLRHPETSLRHVKTFARVPHDTWRVIASYNSQQLVAQTRNSVTGALSTKQFRIGKLFNKHRRIASFQTLSQWQTMPHHHRRSITFQGPTQPHCSRCLTPPQGLPLPHADRDKPAAPTPQQRRPSSRRCSQPTVTPAWKSAWASLTSPARPNGGLRYVSLCCILRSVLVYCIRLS